MQAKAEEGFNTMLSKLETTHYTTCTIHLTKMSPAGSGRDLSWVRTPRHQQAEVARLRGLMQAKAEEGFEGNFEIYDTHRTRPVQVCGHLGTNLGCAAGRDPSWVRTLSHHQAEVARLRGLIPEPEKHKP